VARLISGEIVKGTNQENASFPAGICAERVLLSAASSLFPGVAIETMAISYHNLHGSNGKPISPCGICRQSMMEFQTRTKHPIRIILSGQNGEVYLLKSATDLLPLVFTAEDMK
jgi:cytidine deaminase